MALSSAPPPNFSWVEPRKVAGMALPSSPAQYRYLPQHGVRHLVCLCESAPPAADACPGLTLHHVAVVDFTPPSLDQIHTFLSIAEEAHSRGEGVGVHCMHGHGRTGTMLACYLVKVRNISGVEAIKEIRKLRPGSIETKDQEQAVIKFYQHLHEAATKGVVIVFEEGSYQTVVDTSPSEPIRALLPFGNIYKVNVVLNQGWCPAQFGNFKHTWFNSPVHFQV